jgi:hypothetical protein
MPPNAPVSASGDAPARAGKRRLHQISHDRGNLAPIRTERTRETVVVASLARLGLRASARRKLFQPGEMRAEGRVRRMHLLDLSLTGALAYTDQAPPVNSVVELTRPAGLGMARVVWTKGKRLGLAFARPISAEQLDAILVNQPTLAHAEVLVIR